MEDKILILNQEYEQLLRDSEQIRTVNSLLETGREIPGWVLRAVCGLQQTASSPPPLCAGKCRRQACESAGDPEEN